MSWMGLANAEEMMYEQLKPSLQRKGLHSHSVFPVQTVSDSDGSDCDGAAGVTHWTSSAGTTCRRRGDDQFESHSSFPSASTVLPTTSTSKLPLPHSSSTERGASSSNHQLLDHDEVDREHESRSAFIAMEMEEMDCHQMQCHIQQRLQRRVYHTATIHQTNLILFIDP